MTLAAEPTSAKTSSGSPLPLTALPQGELLTVNESDNPLLRGALAPGVHFKPLRLDLEAGCWVVLAVLSPGAQLPVHYHTGVAEAYTLAGRWYYLEYPDQPQTAGSYLYEPAGSVHTFVCPESNTEDTVVFIRVEGANINFTEDGQFHSVLDAVMIRHLTPLIAEAQQAGPVNYIGGGAAGLMAKQA
ncbi:2,4'-dihydroxyacetophenone dioxygenase family protein [Mycobacterium seoulense]|uniref:2,4'-dihydroxyacetophenone dioxygenase family protein n=1 Tax=Mycobacterium seoulense TaxID=386911 RepID=UPI003CE8AFE2